MRVGIDAHMVGTRETGNERYITGLIGGLQRVDRETRYVVYTGSPKLARRGLAHGESFQTQLLRPVSPWVRIPFGLPAAATRDGLDVLHVTYHAPPRSPCPTVVTVHDLSFRFFAECFSRRDRLILSLLMPYSARRAARVITPSERTKDDLVSEYGLSPDKIVVTPEAAGPQFRPDMEAAALDAVRTRFGLGRPFILTLGNLQPRKNLGRLVQAYAALKATGQIDHQLVIAGQPRWRADVLTSQVRAAGLENEVRFTGYVHDSDLPALYAAADCLAFPSLYEGFGLPVLEAMACGTPVVASNAGAIPEVAGSAAILVNPYRVDEISRALQRILSDAGGRRDLRERGLERARLFSWDRTAELTRQAYRQAAGAGLLQRRPA